MTGNQKNFFYMDSLFRGKALIMAAIMFFVFAIGVEKAFKVIGESGWGVTVIKWWIIGTAVFVSIGSIFYFTYHNKLVLVKVDNEGMTSFWGPVWKRKKVEIPWPEMRAAYVSMVHKKRMVFLWYLPYTDIGDKEQALKILLHNPVGDVLADQIKAINRRLWWDANVEANKEGTELYLREEPVGGYEPLLSHIRKHVE